jgi:hypothetical protein
VRITVAGSIASVRFSVTQKSRSASQALQVVHVVGDRAHRLGLAQQVEVPGRPRRARRRGSSVLSVCSTASLRW